MTCKANQFIFLNCCRDARDFIRRRRSACLVLLDATSFVDVPLVFKDGLDILTDQTVHEALTAGKHTLQEGHVSTMGCHHESNVGQVLDDGHWEGCV